ncbi:hypothetical protein [Frankia sp. Cas3]|uniref:hypothetical protein n=1 Tax=Frankia sp. Cas3 TaxID=3073926 RepID=UPI002AD50614|nr:hypothetical protein [Frankia sp. Cas3]
MTAPTMTRPGELDTPWDDGLIDEIAVNRVVADSAGAGRLRPAEQQVAAARMNAAGLPVRQIARRLQLSEHIAARIIAAGGS